MVWYGVGYTKARARRVRERAHMARGYDGCVVAGLQTAATAQRSAHQSGRYLRYVCMCVCVCTRWGYVVRLR